MNPTATQTAPARDVVLCECFARDGLQHEPAFVPTAAKVDLIRRIADLGFARVEATSYANPKVIPQFADASAVLQALPRKPGVFYKATCANVRAVERALADADAGYGANEISLLVSATDAHSQKNLARSRDAQWRNIEDMAAAAQGRFRLIGTISMAFGCPFEGWVDPAIVMTDAVRLCNLGVRHITLGDTIGVATPLTTRTLFTHMRQMLPNATLIAHFHDTRGTGLANYVAAYDAGVRTFDCALGGTGGHPSKIQYGGGHTGNVATEDLVDLFENMGIRTGIDLDRLLETVAVCESLLGRPLEGRVRRSGLNPLREAHVRHLECANLPDCAD